MTTLPTSSLHKAAGPIARFAVTCLVCFTTITLTACGNGSHFPSAGDRADASASTPGTGANDAPIISGRPLTTAVVNIPYVFRPDVHDPDGDVLVFEIAGKPSWATFDLATGELSGTPLAGIVIFVSDGELKTALSSFSITVTESSATGSTSSASLSWSAPTQNEDGSTLTDLAGYRIYYGTSQSDLSNRIDICNPATTSTLVPNLTRGTWHFAISAYRKNGTESAMSRSFSKVIG